MKLKIIIKQYGLTLILFFYLLSCLTGIFYDFGVNTVGDELPLMSATLKMISDHTLRPNYQSFYHVPLAVYLYLPFFIIFLLALRLSGAFTDWQSIKEFGILNYNQFLPWARFITVLMGAFTIYVLYKTAEKLFKNRTVSLLASALLSSSLLFTQMSHFARVWLPQTLAVVVSFYFIVAVFTGDKTRLKDYVLTGLSIGWALGTHVIGVLIYGSFAAAHYLKNKSKKFKEIFLTNKYFWSVNLIIIIFYFLIAFLNPRGFHNYLNRDGGILPNFNFLFPVNEAGATVGPGALEKFAYYPVVLFQSEPLLTLLFIFGAVVLFFKTRKIAYIIFSFIFIYYIGVSFAGLVPRYVLPVIPFFALAGAYGLYYLYLKINRAAAIAIIVSLLAANFTTPLIWDYRLIQTSAILSVRDWVYKNVPSEKKIMNYDFPLDLNENKQTLNDIKDTTAMFNKKRSYIYGLPEADYPKPNYYILYNSYYEVVPPDLLNKKYDYLILSFWDENDLRVKLKAITDLKLRQTMVLFKKFPETAADNNFSMDLSDMANPVYNIWFKVKQNGPTVYLYKLK